MWAFRLIAALAATAVVTGAAGAAAAFDAHDPGSVLSVINNNGATGDLKTDDKGAPYIDAKAGNLTFSVDFFGCNKAKTACDTLIYTTGWNMTSVTLDQINRWNRWAILCPAYLTDVNHPRAWFGVKPSSNDERSDVKAQDDAWMSCLSDFDKFTDDPEAFLKSKDE